MTDPVQTTAAAPEAEAAQNPELTVNDLNAMKVIIDIASSRGAFKPNEMVAVGQTYTNLTTFLEYDRKGLASTITHVHRSGMYIEQLKAFVKYFRRDQLLVVSSNAIFQNSSKVMDSIAGFLGIEKVDIWNGPFPHDDHLENFQNILDCIKTYIPKLDCSFKEELGLYYKPLNEQLYTWLKEKKQNRSKYEPDFLEFGDSWKNVSCVDDARLDLNKLIESNTKRSCQEYVNT